MPRKARQQEPHPADVATAKRARALLKGAPHLTPEQALEIVGGPIYDRPRTLQMVLGKRGRR